MFTPTLPTGAAVGCSPTNDERLGSTSMSVRLSLFPFPSIHSLPSCTFSSVLLRVPLRIGLACPRLLALGFDAEFWATKQKAQILLTCHKPRKFESIVTWLTYILLFTAGTLMRNSKRCISPINFTSQLEAFQYNSFSFALPLSQVNYVFIALLGWYCFPSVLLTFLPL